MSVTQALGKTTITPKGAWNSQTAYAKLDIVTNQGSAYLAKQAVPAGTLLTDLTYWLLLVAKGSDGTNGTNGIGITSIVKTSTLENVDTYTITYTNGTTSTFQVTNGLNGQNGQDGQNGADGQDGQDGQDGADGEDGRGITSITKTGTSGLVDTYTITYTDNTTSTFEVTNGEDGASNWGDIGGTLSNQADLQAALNAKGTYSKPSGGIPKTDLANAVQTSLNKADTSEQVANRVNVINAQSDNVHIPTAKAVYDFATQFLVNANPNIANYGSVSGGNIYRKGQQCTLTATPNTGFSFVKWKNTDTQAELSTDATYTFTVTDSINITAVFKDDNLQIVPWATGTDEQITAMVDAADNGTLELSDYWAVSDTRTVTLEAMAADSAKGYEAHASQEVELVLLDATCTGFTFTATGTKPHFIVGLKNGLLEKGQMNASNTNVGGWGACKRRGWCNDVFKNAIPAAIRAWFKQFDWQYVQSGNDGTLHTASDYFALAPAKAVFGSTAYSRAEEAALYAQWAYYAQGTSYRIKKAGAAGSADLWWEASPGSGNPVNFCSVSTNGTATIYGAYYSYLLAPFGCI